MVKIHKNILHQSAPNVPGRIMKPKYITVHNTANTDKGANAETHARYQKNGSGGRRASWHYQVDDTEVWQSLNDNQQGWHAGDGSGKGNTESIGIEICENSDGDFKKAVANAQWLIRKLMAEHNIPIENVVPHKHWSGKNCPRKLLDTWDVFIADVIIQGNKDKAEKPAAKPKPAPSKPDIAPYTGGSVVNYLKSIGVDSSSANRRKLAKEYGVVGYDLSAKKNTELLGLLRKGKPAAKPKPVAKTISVMATEVIDGKHGNGHDARRKSLGISQAVYDKVRAEVNGRAGGSKPKKSISQMASEVILGKHGNGHVNRRNSLGISQAEYNKVRAEVNKRS